MIKTLFSKSAQGAAKVAGLYKPSKWQENGWVWRSLLIIGTFISLILLLMFYWSSEPETISPESALAKYSNLTQDDLNISSNIPTGAALTATTIHVIDELQNKTGGYISNDITPPGIIMDNMPQWEYGVLRNLRDISKVFRNNFATSGTQTKLDNDLAELENKLSIDSFSWMIPSPEKSYDTGARALQRYLERLLDEDDSDGQFYARADNLRRFFRVVSPNLGSYSQRLSESVGMKFENMSLAGDSAAEQTTEASKLLFNKTPWHKVDNNFYEARGYAWALLQELKAIQIDFKSVLDDKNATVYIQQLIRELEATQNTVWSPIILNGNGFGVVTNHSLVMASYFSRANSIIIELTNLLENG
ncbi:MAG: DUF2333 family protein [Gammaproteobacteria bacterium]|nr:DUF2333 family protein [Gammaproteobacteria bacterium]